MNRKQRADVAKGLLLRSCYIKIVMWDSARPGQNEIKYCNFVHEYFCGDIRHKI